MEENSIIFSIFLIFSGAAVLSTIALYTRQSLLVAYMLLGIIIGPWGLKLVSDAEFVQEIGEVGIIFLLFLLGMHLPPQKLWVMIRKISMVALISSVVFALTGYGIAIAFGFSHFESTVIGAAMMFSSTIIGLKLLPTTILHHQHTGELMISILLMQDLIAIAVLIWVNAMGHGGLEMSDLGVVILSLPGLLLVAFVVERFVLLKLFARFDRIREYMFLLSIAWCLTMAEMAHWVGLSAEVGAFIAGVTLASSPISLYIAESLKPVRDFFLVIFFFAIGAGFNWHFLPTIFLPALVMAVTFLILKPVVYRLLLKSVSETKHVAWEVGLRLGQVSEFSLLVVFMATTLELVSPTVSYLVQATTILTFMASSYLVVLRYPTPVAISDRLRRD